MPMGPLILLLLLLCHVSTAAAAPASALSPFCAFTDYPSLCLSSIQSSSPIPTSLDVGSAAKLQIDALAAAARSAVAFARTVPADADGCLKQCVDSYADGANNVDAARAALLAGDRGTVMTMLSAAYDSFDCSDVYKEGAGKCRGPSPLKGQDDVLTKLTSNSLAICQHLHY